MSWKAAVLDSQNAWVIDEHDSYLVELVTSDDEGRYIKGERLRENYLRLMAASPDLRAVLNELVEEVDSLESLNPATVHRAKILLEETKI